MDIQDIEIEDNEQVEDTVFSRLERSEVKAAVRKLSEQHRMIITLRFGLNLTHAEIAEEMGISVSYSQNLLAAAIRQLRQTLGVGVNNNHEEE